MAFDIASWSGATAIKDSIAKLIENFNSLWALKWTEKFILSTPADAYVSPSLPLSRNGTMATMDFYVQNTPSAATVVTVSRNGTPLTPTISLSASGKSTLTFSSSVSGTLDDLFTYTVTGAGLSNCAVTCNQKWVNR